MINLLLILKLQIYLENIHSETISSFTVKSYSFHLS